MLPSHSVYVPLLVQARPVQHPWVGEHVCPSWAQGLPGWHVPLVEPVGMKQTVPMQQSAVAVQVPSSGWH